MGGKKEDDELLASGDEASLASEAGVDDAGALCEFIFLIWYALAQSHAHILAVVLIQPLAVIYIYIYIPALTFELPYFSAGD